MLTWHCNGSCGQHNIGMPPTIITAILAQFAHATSGIGHANYINHCLARTCEATENRVNIIVDGLSPSCFFEGFEVNDGRADRPSLVNPMGSNGIE